MSLPLSQWLRDTTAELAWSESSKLDAELILCHVLDVDRTHLYAWPEQTLSSSQLAQLESLKQRRATREPMAYLLGKREFWSLELAVNNNVLVPRPETESLVELVSAALELNPSSASPFPGKQSHIVEGPVLDAGTGSGAIAIALAVQQQSCSSEPVSIFASDRSEKALQVAAQNAAANGVHSIQFVRSNWLSAFCNHSFAIIASNPPYLSQNDAHLQNSEISHEPVDALVSGKDGLNALTQLINDAIRVGKPGCLLALEHGHEQGEAVRELMRNNQYSNVNTHVDFAQRERITSGYCPG